MWHYVGQRLWQSTRETDEVHTHVKQIGCCGSQLENSLEAVWRVAGGLEPSESNDRRQSGRIKRRAEPEIADGFSVCIPNADGQLNFGSQRCAVERNGGNRRRSFESF